MQTNNVKKIAVVGLQFCGSTRLYNFLRLVYESLNYTIYCKVETLEDSSCIIQNNPNKILQLLKYHFYPEEDIDTLKENNYTFLMPYRDIRDSAITAVKRGFVEKDIEHIINFMCFQIEKYYNIINSSSNILCVKYEKWNVDYVKEILTFLNINISQNKINNILKKLEILKTHESLPEIDDLNNTLYKYTYLSKNHITSNGQSKKYCKFFTDSENKRFLENELIFNFLKQYKYI